MSSVANELKKGLCQGHFMVYYKYMDFHICKADGKSFESSALEIGGIPDQTYKIEVTITNDELKRQFNELFKDLNDDESIDEPSDESIIVLRSTILKLLHVDKKQANIRLKASMYKRESQSFLPCSKGEEDEVRAIFNPEFFKYKDYYKTKSPAGFKKNFRNNGSQESSSSDADADADAEWAFVFGSFANFFKAEADFVNEDEKEKFTKLKSFCQTPEDLFIRLTICDALNSLMDAMGHFKRYKDFHELYTVLLESLIGLKPEQIWALSQLEHDPLRQLINTKFDTYLSQERLLQINNNLGHLLAQKLPLYEGNPAACACLLEFGQRSNLFGSNSWYLNQGNQSIVNQAILNVPKLQALIFNKENYTGLDGICESFILDIYNKQPDMLFKKESQCIRDFLEILGAGSLNKRAIISQPVLNHLVNDLDPSQDQSKLDSWVYNLPQWVIFSLAKSEQQSLSSQLQVEHIKYLLKASVSPEISFTSLALVIEKDDQLIKEITKPASGLKAQQGFETLNQVFFQRLYNNQSARHAIMAHCLANYNSFRQCAETTNDYRQQLYFYQEVFSQVLKLDVQRDQDMDSQEIPEKTSVHQFNGHAFIALLLIAPAALIGPWAMFVSLLLWAFAPSLLRKPIALQQLDPEKNMYLCMRYLEYNPKVPLMISYTWRASKQWLKTQLDTVRLYLFKYRSKSGFRHRFLDLSLRSQLLLKKSRGSSAKKVKYGFVSKRAPWTLWNRDDGRKSCIYRDL